MTTSSDWFVELLADASLKAFLLAALAGAGMWVLGIWWEGVRSATVRHRVWTAVLGGMLVMPLLVGWTPGVPLPTWAYPDLQLSAEQRLADVREIAMPTGPAPVTGELPLLEPTTSPPSVATVPAATEIAPTSVLPTVVPTTASWTSRTSTLLVLCYALGVVLFGGRLLLGLIAAQRLVRTARSIELSPEHALELGTTRVLESSHVRVPLTVGWLRPTIVLPHDWPSWSDAMLAAVLAHEQAHVRRRDLWVALLAQVNRAIYWFHPLSWFLARRLTRLAEAACDDAVIESLGDRTGYARHLLAVAGRLAGRPRRLEPVGVAMAARPAVEDRIAAILDDRRPLARRVGWIGSLVLLAAITPVVLLAAGITADKSSPEIEIESPAILASDTGSLILTVLDDNDAPVPGANVKLRIRQAFMGPDAYTHHQTDESGCLEVAVPTPTPYYLSASVTLPGYAPFLAEWENHDAPDPIPAEYTIHLDPGQTIGGSVHDEKGQPIEGASVHPQFNISLREERTYQMGAGVSVKSNAAGEWTYASLPVDVQQLSITFSHPSYVAERVTEPVSKIAILTGSLPSVVTVMKRGIEFDGRVTDVEGKPIDGATVTYFQESRFSSDSPSVTTDNDGAYHFTCGEVGDVLLTVSAPAFAPAKQTVQVAREMEPVDFQLARGTLLRLRVVGPDQKPLHDAFVSFWNWDEQGVYDNLPDSSGKTDANGIWQWSHAPSGLLQFDVSHQGYRYVRGEPLTPGEDNIIVMTRQSAATIEGHMLKVSGRVLDAETNSPIPRFRVTAGYQSEAGGRTIWLQDTQSKGRDGVYRRSFTSNDLGSDTYAIVLRVEADGYGPAVVERAIADKHDFRADVALEKFAAEGFRVLMPNGEAASGATVAVCTPLVGPIVQDGLVIPNSTCERTTTDATGHFSILPQKGLFDLLVLHDSGAAHVTQLQLAKSHTISLEPWARVEGILWMHGKLAANESIRLDRAQSPMMNAPEIFYQYNAKTDEAGKFSFERVVPGRGQVARVAVSQLGGGMSSSTPTLIVDATFAAGETTHVDLGRIGRQVVGKLLMPPDAKQGNDWRLAMIMLKSRPHDAPKQPKLPLPLGMDPQKDQDDFRIWWEEWRFTNKGKEYQKEMKRYADAVNGFKPIYYTGRVEADGTFTFDDIPSGDYTLDVRSMARTSARPFGPGEMIARLEHDFGVPELAGTSASEAVDLGELVVEAIDKAEERTEADAKPQAAVVGEADVKPVVRGRVVMESDGSLVEGAEVRLVTWNEGRTRYDTQKVTSDDLGEFEFKNLPPGSKELVAYFKEMASRKSRYKGEPVELAADGKTYPLFTLKLAEMPRIVVRAVNATDDKPVADALVHLVWSDGERDQQTDANGEATLTRLSREVWHVEVKAPGYAQQVQAINLEGVDTSDIKFALVPGGVLSGIVRDEAGAPVAGAGLSIFRSDYSGGQIEYLESDSEGKYRFGYLPIDSNLQVTVSHDGFTDTREQFALATAPGRELELNIALPRKPHGGTVRGIVTDQEGTPIAGATITNSGRSSRDFREATTDAAGIFVLDDVFEGSIGHELVVKAKKFAPQRLAFKPGPREQPAEVTLKLEPGHNIRGRVVDAGGQPIAGVRVFSSHGNRAGWMEFGQGTSTDREGRFAFDSLPAKAPFSFRADGYSEIDEASLPLDGDKEVVVTLQSAGVIRGRVVDVVTSQPISTFNVSITFSPDRRPDEPGNHLGGDRATSPEGERFNRTDGVFQLGDLLRGMPLQVTVSAEGYDRQTVRRVVAKSADEAKTVEFRLTPVDSSQLIEVRGKLTDRKSQPISGAELRLIVAEKRSFPRDAFPFNWQMIRAGQVEQVDGVQQFLSATSDADGKFAFTEVRPGKDIEIVYWGEGVSPGRIEHLERLTRSERETLAIQVVSPGMVRGRIDRQSMPEVTDLMLTRAREYYQAEVASDQSQYEIRNVPPGSYQLLVYGERIRSKAGDELFENRVIGRHNVEIASGETLTFDLDAEPAAVAATVSAVSVKKDVEPKAAPVDELTAVSDTTKDRVLVRGRVVDRERRPVAGARLWLPVGINAELNDSNFAETATDEQGAFTLSVPRKWLEPAASAPLLMIWCYAPGKCIATASAYQQLRRNSPEPISITLPPASDTGFTVTDPEGKPLAGARVEPRHFLTGAYHIVPTPLREIVGSETDGEGRVKMFAMPREGFMRVQVTADGYGTQQQRFRDAASEPAVRNIQLRTTGRIAGQLVSDNADAIAHVPIHVYQEDFQGEHTAGTAIVRTDEAGKFTVDHFAEGPIHLIVRHDETLLVRPQIPEKLEVFAGETTDVSIPLVAGIPVQGVVRTKEGHLPVPDALVSVSYGAFRQSDSMRSDENGRFHAIVLPGPVRQQLIMRPEEFSHWTEEKAGWEAPFEVAAGAATVELPPIELVETIEHRGRLIDKAGQPVANVMFTAVAGNRRFRFAKTDSDGSFQLWLPKEPAMESYSVELSREDPFVEAKVVSEDPLVLQLER